MPNNEAITKKKSMRVNLRKSMEQLLGETVEIIETLSRKTTE